VTRHRLLSPRWLATGGALVLAGVLSITLLVDHSPACAAPPTTSAHQGKATFYDLSGGQGNCSTQPPADDLYVALGPAEYSGSLSCGGYLDVTGPKGKVRVKVFDSCPECEAGHLDLSRTAFKKIGNEVDGIIPITYKAVENAATPGPLSISFVDGTSQYYWAVTIDNTGNPVASVSVKSSGGSFRTATHTTYNAWLISSGAGNGPFTVKMTDIYGHTATATGIKLEPGKKQTTSVRLTTGAIEKAAAAPAAAKVKKKASPSPTPSKKKASPSPSATATTDAPAPESTLADDIAQAPAVDLAAAPAKSCR
jgi:expansin (peptidoglycan-binding protein)